MPQSTQGDIFQAAARVQLAIVFGHVGLNEMRHRWVAFASSQPQLRQVRDPFTELAGHPVEWSQGKWLWFVPEEQNHGMTDTQLAHALEVPLAWASQNGINSVATNGVKNTDHGKDTRANRLSVDRRVAWLRDYATQAEQKYGLTVELISLNDAFVRTLE